MAKQPFDFKDVQQTDLPTLHKKILEQEPLPLSPGQVKSANDHATIHALVAHVSLFKPSKYFDGELTDGEANIRFVGPDRNQREKTILFL